MRPAITARIKTPITATRSSAVAGSGATAFGSSGSSGSLVGAPSAAGRAASFGCVTGLAGAGRGGQAARPAVQPNERGAERRRERDEAGRVDVRPASHERIGNRHAACDPAQQRRADRNQAGRVPEHRRKDQPTVGEHGNGEGDTRQKQPEITARDRRERDDVVEAHRRVGDDDGRRGRPQIAAREGERAVLGCVRSGAPSAH